MSGDSLEVVMTIKEILITITEMIVVILVNSKSNNDNDDYKDDITNVLMIK